MLCKTCTLESNRRGASDQKFWWLTGCGRSPKVILKTFECIANEWQAHLRHFFTRLSRCNLFSLETWSGIGLIDFVNWEIGRVNVRRQSGLKGSANTPEGIEGYASKEGMAFDLIGGASTKTILRVTNETRRQLALVWGQKTQVLTFESGSPPLALVEHPLESEVSGASLQFSDKYHEPLRHRTVASQLDIQTW